MSREFNKEDFQKGAEKEICNHCGTEEGTFTLIQDKLDEAFGKRGTHLVMRRKPGIDSLINTLQKNIFSSIDKIGEDIINGQSPWKSRLQEVSLRKHLPNRSIQEPNEGLLEVMHFLGDEIQYHRLLFSLPSIWNEQLNEFYKMVFFGKAHPIDEATASFNSALKNVADHWSSLSEEEAVSFLRKMISDSIPSVIRGNVQGEINETASSIHTYLSDRGIKNFGDWEENYANNSPLSVLTPRLLSNQFKKEEVFEGVKYCDYCGAVQSRSLMYSGLFIPFAGAENNENEVVNYLGRIQDIETEFLSLIQDLWEEQGEELKRRDKKANKMWDSAEDRLKKKQEDEKERKRQAEIAKLEKKLKAIKNNDE